MDDSKKARIEKTALYLRQLQWQDDFLEGRLLSDGQVQTLREEIKQSLEFASHRAQALEKELIPILGKVENSGLLALLEPLREAWDSAVNTSVCCALALEQLPGPRTREKRYHLAAVRIAVAMDDDNAREVARQIIREAGLDEDYSEASLTNWLKKARDIDGFRRLKKAGEYPDTK